MFNVLKRNLKVEASLTDVNIQFGLLPALTVAQDNMCEYFRQIGCDGVTMIPVCNCFFVLTKSKLKFNDFAKWLDEFSVNTELVSKSKIRVELQTEFESNGNILATCVHQMCPMDVTDRCIRPVEKTLMSQDLLPTKEGDLSFQKLTFELTEEDYKYSHKINVSNLDFYKHTNNLQYVGFMLSCLDLEFVENNAIDDFEIHYIAESRYGDELRIYMKMDECQIMFQINKEDKCITKGLLTYRKR